MLLDLWPALEEKKGGTPPGVSDGVQAQMAAVRLRRDEDAAIAVALLTRRLRVIR